MTEIVQRCFLLRIKWTAYKSVFVLLDNALGDSIGVAVRCEVTEFNWINERQVVRRKR